MATKKKAQNPQGDRRIEYVPLSQLVPDEANPKAHDLALIGSSVGRFGYVEPIVEDGRTGKLISGHGRTATLQAMADRGETAPDGVTVDQDGNWLVPVAKGWSSRSDNEARAALISMNRTGEVGGWVDNSLLELLEELSEDQETGLEGVGFSDKEFLDLQNRLTALTDTNFNEDQMDDLADQWDQSSGLASPSVTIKITDPWVMEQWSQLRQQHDQDDQAMQVLLQALLADDEDAG